jgi:hypothetical protein
MDVFQAVVGDLQACRWRTQNFEAEGVDRSSSQGIGMWFTSQIARDYKGQAIPPDFDLNPSLLQLLRRRALFLVSPLCPVEVSQ